jgi:hypothetical protein
MVPALIALVLSVWAVGRGGILSSAFLAIGIFFVVKKTRLDYLVIVLGCILLFVGLYGEEFLPVLLFEKSFSLSKFDFGVVELARADIIGRYISMLDIDRVLVGFDWYESYYLFPSGNLHNSYLELHYRIGIFAFMVVLMAFIALAKGLLHKRIYFVLLATIMIRAVSDTVMLPAHMFDFVFYFLVTVSILLGENSVHKAAQTRLLNSASISHRLNRARLFEG